MKAESFLEKIQKKPEKRISNADVQTLLLQDIKSLLEKISGDKKLSNSWFKRIFK